MRRHSASRVGSTRCQTCCSTSRSSSSAVYWLQPRLLTLRSRRGRPPFSSPTPTPVWQDPWPPDPWKLDREIRCTTTISDHGILFWPPHTAFPDPVTHSLVPACLPASIMQGPTHGWIWHPTRDGVSSLPTFSSALNLTTFRALHPAGKVWRGKGCLDSFFSFFSFIMMLNFFHASFGIWWLVNIY